MKDISFIDDLSLRKRITDVITDVFDLGTMIEKQDKEKTKSCLRKTMIIYTVSVIEALLVWKLRKEISAEKISLSDEMKYSKPQKINEAGNLNLFVVKGKKETRKITDLNLNRVIDICSSREIITDEDIIDKLHEVRKMRNELHIGGLKAARKVYSQDNLKFVFDVLEDTIIAIQ